ncbi:DUF1433 domain-containing protein [Staphylococcus simulans]|uniref:DUF1433 domain-containing protein n=1 Tax=Staphylococcus simulans TaxID=1286 RepID=UPI00399AEDFF
MYLKYNLNDLKSVKFTKTWVNPIGFYVIKGYISNDEDLHFTDSTGITNTSYYLDNLGGSEEFMKLLKRRKIYA